MFHDRDGRQIHSVSFGAGPTTLVGIPGSIASWEIWSPVMELLSGKCRVISFDHDGVGQTKVPVEEINSDRHLDTLLSVLDHHDADRCVIAGDSNNASLAIRAAALHPEVFSGLVIVSGHAWGYDYPAARQFVAALRSDFDSTVSWFVDMVFPEPDVDHLKAWLRDIIDVTGPEASAAIIESYFGLDVRSEAASCELPSLVISGALDSIHPHGVDGARDLARLLDASLEIIEDAGHLPLLSRPERVASALEQFLERLG